MLYEVITKIQLIPIPLQSVYSTADLPPFVTSLFSVSGIITILSTIGLLAMIAYGLWRRSSTATFAALYIISFAITSNIFIPIGVTMAERLTYFPSIWFCAGIARNNFV